MSLQLRALTVRFGARVAVDGVDLHAHPGEVLAVLGPNGSGKSSLLRAIAGLLPSQGEIRRKTAWRSFYMPQDSFARASLTAFEVALLGRVRSLGFRPATADLDAAAAALAELGIGDLADRRIGELSGGQRQMVFLAQLLVAEPQVMLLDEPTSALDVRHQLALLELLRRLTRERGLVTILALHDLNAAARFADRVALLSDGRLLAEGTPEAVLTAATLAEAYQVEAQVHRAPDGHLSIAPSRALESRAPAAQG